MKLILDDGRELNVTLSDEEVNKLCNKDALWFPRNGEKAWYIDSVGDVEYGDVWSKESPCDMYRHKLGHIFKTKEEAEKHLALIEAKYAVRKRIAELNNGWNTDFMRETPLNYNLCINNSNINADYYCTTKFQPNWMYLKSRELADQLIEELEPELRLVLEE